MYQSLLASRLIVAASIVWAILMAYFCLRINSNTQQVETWFSSGTEIHQQYREFVDRFGNDDFILIAWDDCTLDDPRLTELETWLNRNRQAGYFRIAISGKTMMDRLIQAGRRKNDALARLHRVFVGNDLKSTCIQLTLTEKGHQERRAALEELRRVVNSYEALHWEDLKLAGPAYMGVMIDHETNRSMRFAFPASVIGTILTIIFVRRIRLVFAVMFVAMISGLSSLGILSGSGGSK